MHAPEPATRIANGLFGCSARAAWPTVANLRKHGVSFELASTVFNDPRLLTVADLEHSETEERWFSIGVAYSGAMLSIVYRWLESDRAPTKIRLISAREAKPAEIRDYEESL